MKTSTKQQLFKLSQLRYVNRSIIFAADLSFSVLGTFLSYIYILTFLNKWEDANSILTVIALSAIISTAIFWTSGLYKVIIRHSTLKELPRVFFVLVAKEVVMSMIVYHFSLVSAEMIAFCALADLSFTGFLMVGFRAFVVNLYYSVMNVDPTQMDNVFVYSTLERSPMIAEAINKNPKSKMNVCGFLTTNKRKKGMRIYDQKVYWLDGNENNLLNLFKTNKIKAVIFTSQRNFNRERNGLVEFCIKHQIKMHISMGLQDLNSDTVDLSHTLKPIQIEDLLDRSVIEIEGEKINAQLVGKIVMVTGAAGSIGSEIVRQLARFDVQEIICFDNAETPLHNLQLEMEVKHQKATIRYCLGDVRSKNRVAGIMEKYRPSVIFHAAAYKHVPMIEANPCESVRVNVWGTLNMAQRALEFGVEKFVMVSTDKAVNPTNIMGASKRVAELCVQHCNRKGATKFIITRFGNVLGSNGSVIPRFREQIAKGGPITVTHPDITRYFMTIPEACCLVLQASAMGEGGEIFVFDMGKQIKIVDLAHKMILLSGLTPQEDVEIVFTGLRPGEKLYEELLSDKENTVASSHNKIRISQTDVELSDGFIDTVEELISASVVIDIENSVIIMKKIVPEFISNNSEFEKYDTFVKK